MKKVLFISSRRIYPTVDGGRIRTAQQLEFLVKRCIVDVIYITDVSSQDEVKNYLPQVNKVKEVVMPKWKSCLQTLRAAFNSLPLQVNYYYSDSLRDYISSHAGEYDIVFCNNIRTAEYVRTISGPVKCIDFVDAIYMNYENAASRTKGFKRFVYKIDFKRCRRYEQILLDSFDRCAIISDVDKNYILKCPIEFIL